MDVGRILGALVAHQTQVWDVSTEQVLAPSSTITLLGLELEVDPETGDLLVRQSIFVRQLLTKHGLDRLSKPAQAMQMAAPGTDDEPPTASELKVTQVRAGKCKVLVARARST
eukprot:4627369-Pyramimonas_sp.AAC.1